MQLSFFLRQSRVALTIGLATLAAVGSIAASGTARAADGTIPVAQAEKPSGQGILNSVDAARRKLNITHGPVAALNWPGMTMDFQAAPGVDLGALKPGSKIAFTLARGIDGMFVIDDIRPSQ
jgi:Cu/Ag efflux protein CusF